MNGTWKREFVTVAFASVVVVILAAAVIWSRDTFPQSAPGRAGLALYTILLTPEQFDSVQTNVLQQLEKAHGVQILEMHGAKRRDRILVCGTVAVTEHPQIDPIRRPFIAAITDSDEHVWVGPEANDGELVSNLCEHAGFPLKLKPESIYDLSP